MKNGLAILFFFILLTGIKGMAQNPYYDAIRLKKYTNKDGDLKSTEDSVYFILDDYIQPEKKNSIHEIDSILRKDKNPFFILSGAARSQAEDNKTGSFFRGAISSIPGLDVTNVADGLAQFLIERGKEELNIAFFQRMQEFLEKNIEAKTLFPSTVQFLGKIASYRYSEFLPTLREAFYKDINNLIVNLNVLIDLPKYQDVLKTLPEIRVAIRSAKIISELSQPDSSMHPANLISHLATLNEWGEMNINLQSSWRVLDKISESVRKSPYTIETTYDTTISRTLKEISRILPGKFVIDTQRLTKNFFLLKKINVGADTAVQFDTIFKKVITPKFDTITNNDVAWIKFSDFNTNVLDDSITLKIYLGLLYQKMDGIIFVDAKNNEISAQRFMKNNATNIFKIAGLIENFLVLANDVDQSVKDIKNKKNNLSNDDYYTYIQKAIDVVDYGFKVANTIKDGIADDRYIKIARSADDLYKNIYTKNYNAAVMNAYVILEEVLTKYDISIQEKDKRIISSLLANVADPGRSFIEKDLKKLYSIHTNSDTIKGLLTGSINLSVISDTALRKNLIIDTSKIKDVTRNNIKLDSLVGYLESFTSPPSVPDSNTTTVERILKYGNLMASIVKSESPQEAEAAIEAAVLPAGSSSIKKNSRWNISLNAYIGGYFGRNSNSTDKIDGNNSSVGVTAPIGVAVSWGLGYFNKGNSIGSLSLYGTLIDVGAIAGYRLNDDSTTLEQKVTLNDIFAPGAYLVYGIGLPFKGFPYIPISVGYGWQYGSKLYHKQDDGTLAISDKSRWRSNWFVAVDIPLVNFYTRSYKKKN